MDEDYFKKIMTTIILVGLIVLSFLLIKPLIISIIVGIILAFAFTPVYTFLLKYLKSKDLSALFICMVFALLLVIPLWLVTPLIFEQTVNVYNYVENVDFITPLKTIFPYLLGSPAIPEIVESIIDSSFNRLLNNFTGIFTIDNLITLSLQLLVVFFTFFFVLRDQQQFLDYVKSFLPFTKDIQSKLFTMSRDLTTSIIYGQIIVGVIQGIIVGISFFLFGIPNALFLTVLAIFMGIFPIIGTALVWVPVSIYLLAAGSIWPAMGVAVLGVISSTIDNFLRPIIVSKKTNINSSILIVGMIGGLLLFGILGLILGPLILAYLLIILELYRNKKTPGLIQCD